MKRPACTGDERGSKRRFDSAAQPNEAGSKRSFDSAARPAEPGSKRRFDSAARPATLLEQVQELEYYPHRYKNPTCAQERKENQLAKRVSQQ